MGRSDRLDDPALEGVISVVDYATSSPMRPGWSFSAAASDYSNEAPIRMPVRAATSFNRTVPYRWSTLPCFIR